MEIGFPYLNDAFLSGQDILYGQFNDVSFYIEDEDQENFYFIILKNLFHTVKFEKIFPLNGKSNVKEEARNNIDSLKKVYIVDKDFDDLLSSIEDLPNLFYLKRYSIENYLIEEDAIKRYVIEEKPKLKLVDIELSFNYGVLISEASNLFGELTAIHLVVQKYSLGIPNISKSPDRFCTYTPVSVLKNDQIVIYKSEIDAELKIKNSSLDIEMEIAKVRQYFPSNSSSLELLKNIPGKYLLKFMKSKSEDIFHLANRNIDSFMYRLAKNSSFEDMNFLKAEVNAFLNS